MGSPIRLGKMVSSDKLGVSLHGAAKQGNKRAVKRAIDKGIYVDYPNDEGQTPLFCACFANQEGVAKLLLQRGADPNEKSNNGQTPVLMICLRGNISLLQKMMDAGGDLRYHDNDGRGCIDWALMNEDPKKRIKMIDFINKTRVHAMTSAEQEVRFRKDSNRRSRTMLTVPESLVDIIRKKIGGIRPLDSTNSISRVESRGFGRVYTGDKDGGLVSVTPLVPEANLQFDAYGPSFDNGAFMAMESMFWYKSTVTVKKLHKVTQPGGYIDLLITEAEKLGKLHHPNILLLMGVCQAYTMDSMMLVFERINVGSIYYYLHAKLERLPTQNIRDIVIQICDAMIFLHQNDIIHCNLSSHAVFLVNPYSAKIGNFEYAMDSEKAGLGKQSAASQMKYQNALYNWMAPELMDGNEPGFYSDVYSYCCLLWEIFVCEVPWDMCDAELIKHKVLVERKTLMRENDKIPNLFKTIIRYGLEIEYNTRMLDFETIRTWLAAPPDSIPTLPQRHITLEETEPKCIDDVDGYTRHAGKMVDDRHRQHNTSPYRQRKHSPSPDKAGSTRQPRSSSYCHNENNHHDHHRSEHRSRRQKQEWYDDEDDVDFCKNESYNYYEKHPKSPGKRSLPGHYTRKIDGVQFDVDRHNDGQMVGYHVKVRSPKTRQKHQSRSRPNSYQKESTNTESSNEERRTFIPSDNKRIDLCSPSKFSYLSLNQKCGPNETVVKPASHHTEGGNQYNTQLSTAGSLYALYNASHDTSREEESFSPTYHIKTHKDCETGTRRNREIPPSPSPEAKSDVCDPSWFGGQGSVKNLVGLYQKHTNQHFSQQAVLLGQKTNADKQTFNNSAFDLPPQYPRSSSFKSPPDDSATNTYYARTAKTRKDVNTMQIPKYKKIISQESKKDTHMDNVGQYSTDDSLTTLSTGCSLTDPNNHPEPQSASSVDSDLITAWVDDELQKVQRDLQQEVSMCTPTKEAEDEGPADLLEEIMDEVCRPKFEQYPASRNDKKAKRYTRKEDVDPFEDDSVDDCRNYSYTDRKRYKEDDFILHKPRNNHNHSDGEHMAYYDIFSDDNYLALPSVQTKKKPKTKSKRNTHTNTDSYVTNNKSNSTGYLTTVRVETSLQHPGHHFLTHTSKDLSTGKTKTIHSEEITANRIQSSIGTE